MIRPAVRDDAARLSRIAMEAKAHWGYPGEWLQLWADELQVSPVQIETCPTWVVEEQGEVVAFAMLSDPCSDPELEHLWVLPECMGRGHGASLLATVLAHCRAQGEPRLRVVADPNAEPFYRAQGATLVGYVDSVPAPRRLPVLDFAL